MPTQIIHETQKISEIAKQKQLSTSYYTSNDEKKYFADSLLYD